MIQKIKCFFGFHGWKYGYKDYDDLGMLYFERECIHCGKETSGIVA